MICNLSRHLPVTLCISSSSPESIKEKLQSNNSHSTLNINNVHFLQVDFDSIWLRDFGPIFFAEHEHEHKHEHEKIMLFKWNDWGYRDYFIEPLSWGTIDESFAEKVSSALHLPNQSVPYVMEGGDREFNGDGLMITCEDVELQRNPGFSKKQLEELYLKDFNISHVIWLKNALIDDFQSIHCPLQGFDFFTPISTGGHVDETCRFVSSDSVLLADVHPKERDTPLGKIVYEALQVNYEILAQFRDSNGRALKIHRIYLPPPIFREVTEKDNTFQSLSTLKHVKGHKLIDQPTIKVIAAASYCNFLISNGIVLVSKYYKEGRDLLFKETDDYARDTLQRLFPDREVCQIEAEAINFGGGGMHCITQQRPC